jgi:hypothetical protein
MDIHEHVHDVITSNMRMDYLTRGTNK